MKKYKLIICSCGCKKHFHKSQSKPIEYKVTAYCGLPTPNEPKEILEIKRADGILFKVGDTVQRVTERGTKKGKGIIYKIEDLTEKHPSIGLRLFVHMIGYNGIAYIENVNYENADYSNMFRFLINITKKH